MSVYEPKHIAQKFIQRSLDNRKIINQLIKDNPNIEYEITNKINSLFGFVLFPVDCFNAQIKTNQLLESIEDTYINEFKVFFKKIKSDYRFGSEYSKEICENIDSWTASSVWEVLKCIRHCLAHSGKNGITFLPQEYIYNDNNAQIQSVLFYCYNKNNLHRQFVMELKVEENSEGMSELDELTELIINFLVKIGDHHFVNDDDDDNDDDSKDPREHALTYLNKIKKQH